MGFHGGSDGKESACNAEDLDSVPRSGRSREEGNGHPLQYSYSCLENPMDKNLVGYSSWDRKESDMTKRVSFFHLGKRGKEETFSCICCF